MPLYEAGKLLYNESDTKMGGVAVNCMKCGRETMGDAVFCDDCLEHMARHPVPANTLVYVPSEKDRASAKKHSTVAPVITAEDQVKRLTRKVHALGLLLALALGAAVFFGLLSADALHELSVSDFIGKNYTSITSSATMD